MLTAQEETARPVRFTRFAVRRTGLLSTHVWIRIGPHHLSCAPFQLSRQRGVFLAVLSAQERRLFQRFHHKPCRVGLAFRAADPMPPRAVVLRGFLRRLASLRDGRGVCLLDIPLLACPSDLEAALGDCLRAVDGLKRLYEYFAGRAIDLNEMNGPLVGFNGLAELLARDVRCGIHITSLGVDRLTVTLSDHAEAFRPGVRCVVRPILPGGSFDVNAEVLARKWTGEETAEILLRAEFTPELVEMVDGLFFRRELPAVKPA